jgi:hypothetical protein
MSTNFQPNDRVLFRLTRFGDLNRTGTVEIVQKSRLKVRVDFIGPHIDSLSNLRAETPYAFVPMENVIRKWREDEENIDHDE